MKPRFGALVASLALVTLAACSSVPSASESASDIPASVANASTPEDHQRLADYFTQKAASYEKEAAWHEKIADSYAKRPKGDLLQMVAHCRALRDQFTAAAKESRQIADAHRQLASAIAK